MCTDLIALMTRELTLFQDGLSECKSNRKIMKEYGIMEYLELSVTRCGRWTGNREFIWSGLSYSYPHNYIENIDSITLIGKLFQSLIVLG